MMEERYLEKRKSIEAIFQPDNLIPDSGSEILSPSGNFKLQVDRYSPGPNRWDYSRGIVTRLSDNNEISDIKRNYGAFWHAWVEHPNGHEYLLFGEDYQGYSVLNLNSERTRTYFPETGYKGAGFCWAAVYPSPDNLVLAVDGCFWACPYDLVMYDFRNPEELPYKELLRAHNIYDNCGWQDNDTFSLENEVEIRKSDGIPYDDLSIEEQDLLNNNTSLIDYRYDMETINRPPFNENA